MSRWRKVKNKIDKNLKSESLIIKSETPVPLMIRFKAFIVDSFMITMPIMYIVVYLVMGSGDNFSQNKVFGWSVILVLHAAILLGFLIFKKETPGMRAYSLKLTHSNSGKKVNIFQIIVRYILTMPSIVLFGLIPYFRKDKRMFHDLFSNTYFISTQKESV